MFFNKCCHSDKKAIIKIFHPDQELNTCPEKHSNDKASQQIVLGLHGIPLTHLSDSTTALTAP